MGIRRAMPGRSRRYSPPTRRRAGWRGRPRAADARRVHRGDRRAHFHSRGGPLRRRQGGRHPGAALLARLRPSDPAVAPRGDGVLDLLDSVRRLREDGGARRRRHGAGGGGGGAGAEPIDPARAFDKKPVAVRLMVVCAGVAMNALLAFVIFAVLAGSVGTPELNTTRIDSVVTTRLPAGARALASLAPGDRIVRVNDDTIRTWDDVVRQIVSGPAELTFQVAGRAEPLMIDLGQGGLAARQAVADALVPEVPVGGQRLEG